MFPVASYVFCPGAPFAVLLRSVYQNGQPRPPKKEYAVWPFQILCHFVGFYGELLQQAATTTTSQKKIGSGSGSSLLEKKACHFAL